MTLSLWRRCTRISPVVNPYFLSKILDFSSSASTFPDHESVASQSWEINDKRIACENESDGLHLSPLFWRGRPHLGGCKIELVDAEAWQVSSGLAEAWRGTNMALDGKSLPVEATEEVVNSSLPNKDDPDFDEIEDMRIRGNLFYKLDRDSKEFEEYSFDFHRRKSSKSKYNNGNNEKKKSLNNSLASRVEKPSKGKEVKREGRKMESLASNLASKGKGVPLDVPDENFTSSLNEMDSSCVGKKVRTPTFNQLTAPYHEPFCLDIYISKGSVRACIIHRATSKVVAVAHSISKDMKFDLASTKNASACVAVGEILAQRALADDIHNVVYTPRNGEILEGKLQIVLQSIINSGINVKVKIKQRRKKASYTSAA